MNNLYKLLDKIESAVMDGIPVPLLPFTVVNQEKLIDLLDKVHVAIPEEIQVADQIISKRDNIMDEVQQKAHSMLQEAKHRSESMLTDSELLRAVKNEADRIRQQVIEELDAMRSQTREDVEKLREEAIAEAKLIREQADEYANAVLRNLSESLAEFQNVAQNGQKHLSKVRGDVNARHQKTFVPAQSKDIKESRLNPSNAKKKSDYLSMMTLQQSDLSGVGPASDTLKV